MKKDEIITTTLGILTVIVVIFFAWKVFLAWEGFFVPKQNTVEVIKYYDQKIEELTINYESQIKELEEQIKKVEEADSNYSQYVSRRCVCFKEDLYNEK